MRKLTLFSAILAVLLAAFGGALLAQDDASTTDDSSSAWLGVAIQENSDGQVVVTFVQSGSPADTADLQVNDVITSFNGETVDSAQALVDLVQAAAPGDVVTLEILRNDETQSIDVTLGTTPTTRFGRGNVAPGTRRNFEFNMPGNMDISSLEAFLVADLEEADGGYQVLDVFSLVNPFQLQEGDLVTAINGIDVTDFDMLSLMQSLSSMDQPTVTVTVTRDGEELSLEGDAFMHGFGMGMFGDQGFMMPFGHNFDGRGRDAMPFGRMPGNRGDQNNDDDANTEGAMTVPTLPSDGQA